MANRPTAAAILIPGLAFALCHLLGASLPRPANHSDPYAARVDAAPASPPADLSPTQSVAVDVLTKSKSATSNAEFPALFEAVFAIPDEANWAIRSTLVRQLATRWATSDPRAALDWLVALPSDQSLRSTAIDTVYGVWGRTDPVAACEAAMSLKESGLDDTFRIDSILRAQAKSDPERFLELVERYGHDWNHTPSSWAFEVAFEGLGRGDPDSLSTWLTKDHPKHVSKAAAKALGRVLAESKGADCFSTLSEITDEQWRESAIDSAMAQLIEANLTAAQKFTEKVLDANALTPRTLTMVIQSAARDDPDAAARWFASIYKEPGNSDHKTRDQWRSARTALYGALPNNAQALHDFITGAGADLPGLNVRNLIASAGRSNNTGGDRAPLAVEILALPQDPARDEMLMAMVGHWFYQTPDAAVAFAEAMPAGPLRQKAMMEILGSARLEPETILALGDELDEGSALPPSAMRKLAAHQPADAIEHFESLPPGSRSASEGAWILAEILAIQDPEAGGAWIENLADETAQIEAARRFARSYDYDVFGLSAWAATLPQGALFDTVADALVDHAAPVEPDMAFEWALAIGDPAKRIESAGAALAVWAKADREAAEHAILNVENLSEDQQRSLFEQLDAPPSR